MAIGSIGIHGADASRAGAQEVGEVHRRLRCEFGLDPHLVAGRAARVVGAVDRQTGDLAVVVGAVGLATEVGVGEHLQQGAVLLGLGEEQCVGEDRPQLRAVERGGDTERQLAWRQDSIAVVGREVADRGDLLDQTGVDVECRAHVGERAVGVGVAGRGEALECSVEAGALLEADERAVVGRFDGAVQDQRPHTVGEQLGIRGTEPRAVGETDIAELVVAETRARRASRSRAALLVPTNGSSARESGVHVSTRLSASATNASHPASSPGASSDTSSSKSTSQSIAVLAPTPRGSNETRSNRSVSSGGITAATLVRNSMPDPPGPPGLNTSEPMRRSSSAVAARATAMSIVSPSGAEWSSGTTSVAHSSPAISAATPVHDDQASVPVSGFGVTGAVGAVRW